MTLPYTFAEAPPLEPDEDAARDWLIEELARSEYQDAKPNPIDQFFNDVWEWLSSLFVVDGSGAFGINPAWVFIIIAIILVVILIVIFGRPKAVARRRAANQSVFLDDDNRTAAELRAAADAAAREGNWDLAITERFRAISRSLSDRTLIALRPGTTAQGVAQAATKPFPNESPALRGAANAFDAVRYLDKRTDSSVYEQVRGLDQRLESSRPASLLPANQVAG
ncbi:MAG: DUF4129 domain-containing protein [Gulosibacter sp.]|uniref:DUF4129 domain-containing protein n=1 Tax=Gulosibacter sp. TaxID=2817531 RepID=UPI003F8FC6A6